MTKDERKHYERLVAFGCCVCNKEGRGHSSAEIHHIRSTAGMGQKSHWSTAIPLCPVHHRLGRYGTAIHQGQKEFERLHGSEVELLEYTLRMIGE